MGFFVVTNHTPLSFNPTNTNTPTAPPPAKKARRMPTAVERAQKAAEKQVKDAEKAKKALEKAEKERRLAAEKPARDAEKAKKAAEKAERDAEKAKKDAKKEADRKSQLKLSGFFVKSSTPDGKTGKKAPRPGKTSQDLCRRSVLIY